MLVATKGTLRASTLRVVPCAVVRRAEASRPKIVGAGQSAGHRYAWARRACHQPCRCCSARCVTTQARRYDR